MKYRRIPAFPWAAIMVSLILPLIPARAGESAPESAKTALTLTAPTSGICRAVYVRTGQEVAVGEQVAAVSPEGDSEILVTYRAAVTAAVTRLDGRRTDYQRSVQAIKKGDGASSTVIEARIRFEEAARELDRVRRDLHEAEHRLRPRFVHAPARARVVTIHVAEGAPVAVDAPLVTLETLVPPADH